MLLRRMVTVCVVATCLVMGAAAATASPNANTQSTTGSPSSDDAPWLGVLLSPGPLPELVTVHLGLEPDQGIAVENVQLDSPAAEIGLSRSDIILELDGQAVGDTERFVSSIRQRAPGDTIELVVLQEGERQRLSTSLAERPEQPGAWKHPRRQPAPGLSHQMPGPRGFGPGGGPGFALPLDPQGMPDMDALMERFGLDPNDLVGPGTMPGLPDDQLKQLRRQFGAPLGQQANAQTRIYTQRGTTNGESWEVTIEGDPDASTTMVSVRLGADSYHVPVSELDTLPPRHRQLVEDALENARGNAPAPGLRSTNPLRRKTPDAAPERHGDDEASTDGKSDDGMLGAGAIQRQIERMLFDRAAKMGGLPGKRL